MAKGVPVSSVPELVADAHCQIAEGPVWHPDEQCLYWTDIPAGKVYRFDPAIEKHELVYQGESVGGMTIQSDGSLLLLGAHGSVRSWRDGQVTDDVLLQVPEERNTRFNDVLADSSGRVISGTMAERDARGAIVRYGQLYRLEASGQFHALFGGMGSPNGMGFSGDQRHMYLTESIVGTQAIFRFEYDADSGTLDNRTMFHQSASDGRAGRPDGLTVDVDDCIWSARWDGAAVVRFDPEGRECERYTLPVAKVTSLTFGGPDYTDLYITTATSHHPDEDGRGAGGLFRLQTGARGRAEFRSRVGLY